MAYKRNPVGRPPKYKSVEEIQGKIDAYFTACKGHPLMNPDTGEPFQDKYGLPIIVDAKPPTVSGLALALGFSCRRDLNAYQGKRNFAPRLRARRPSAKHTPKNACLTGTAPTARSSACAATLAGTKSPPKHRPRPLTTAFDRNAAAGAQCLEGWCG